jgi:hypothetical protein
VRRRVSLNATNFDCESRRDSTTATCGGVEVDMATHQELVFGAQADFRHGGAFEAYYKKNASLKCYLNARVASTSVTPEILYTVRGRE